MKDKRVLLIASFPESLPNFRGDLIQAFNKAGFHVHCAAPELSGHIKVKNKLDNWHCTCHDLPFKRSGINPIFDLMALVSLIFLLFRYRFQIVIGYTIKPIIYGSVAAWILKVPIRVALVTGLGFSFTSQDGFGYSFTQRVAQHLYRIAMFCATKVFFQNKDDSALFVDHQWVDPAKIELIAGSGVNTARFPFVSVTQKSPIHFLMIARFLRDKGLVEYVEAARIVKRKYPSATFSLAGWLDDNPAAVSQEDLDQWVSEGTVNLLGKLEDVCPAIGACSVYVLPSYREGTPRTVLEAMAMGRPIITTDAPGCRDTVIEGENGFLVPIKSPQALAEMMIRFIEQPELLEVMGKKSREFAEGKYDVDKVNETILKSLGVFSDKALNILSEPPKVFEGIFKSSKQKICIIASSQMTIQAFLLYHIEMLSKYYDVTVVANFPEIESENHPGFYEHRIDIQRKINIVKDISALFYLWHFFARNSFHATLSVTPKAGLLAVLAGALAGVPTRFHWFTGQIWVTREGFRRDFLKSLDWFVALLCNKVLVDGHSQYKFLKDQGVFRPDKGIVFGKGSISGVDFNRFKVDRSLRHSVRNQLGISPDEVVILFLGRINRDKGILDLASAFSSLARKNSKVKLLCVGPDEENLLPTMKRICKDVLDRIIFKGYTSEPEAMMNASDIFCLPSYREGFGSVVLEAAVCGLPSVVSRIYGLEGSVVENKTGLFFEPKNISEISDKLSLLYNNTSLRSEMAEAAMARTLKYFSREKITDELIEFFLRYVPVGPEVGGQRSEVGGRKQRKQRIQLI